MNTDREMSKITLDKNTFKVLASDARLKILRALDGRKMNLSELAKKTDLNKATVHEHLEKLHKADLIKKKSREGHKWVYYKLSWKGLNLLHPENTKIVLMFSVAFVFLTSGLLQLWWYAKGQVQKLGQVMLRNQGGEQVLTNATKTRGALDNATNTSTTHLDKLLGQGKNIVLEPSNVNMTYDTDVLGNVTSNASSSPVNATTTYNLYSFMQDPIFLYAAVICFVIFAVILAVTIIKFWRKREPQV